MDLRERSSSLRRYAERLFRFRLPLFLLFILFLATLGGDLFWTAREWGPVVPLQGGLWIDLLRTGGFDYLSDPLREMAIPLAGSAVWILFRFFPRPKEGLLLLFFSAIGVLPAAVGWAPEWWLLGGIVAAAVGAVVGKASPGSPVSLLLPWGLAGGLIPAIGGGLTLSIHGGGYGAVALIPVPALAVLFGELLTAAIGAGRVLREKPTGMAAAAEWIDRSLPSISRGWIGSVVAMAGVSYFLFGELGGVFALTLSLGSASWLVLGLLFPLLLSLLSGRKKSVSGYGSFR